MQNEIFNNENNALEKQTKWSNYKTSDGLKSDLVQDGYAMHKMCMFHFKNIH